MQKRTILKYENLIKEYKKDFLSYKKGKEIRGKNHDFSIVPQYFRYSKKVMSIDDIWISMIIGFALKLKNYKLALKNLKWVYLNTKPYKRPLCSNITAAIIWYKNNKLNDAENILRLVLAEQPRYRKIFTTEPLNTFKRVPDSISFIDHVEGDIHYERTILSNPDYADFVEWVQKVFYIKQLA